MAGTVDPCLRVLQDKGSDMPQYTSQSEGGVGVGLRYGADGGTYGAPPPNGHPDTYSSASSHVSGQSGGPVDGSVPNAGNGGSNTGTLIARTQKQQTTQQVTTVTKVIREVHHLGPDGQPVDFYAYGTSPNTTAVPASGVGSTSVPGDYSTYGTTRAPSYPADAAAFEAADHQDPYGMRSPAGADPAGRHYPNPYQPGYQDYDHYPPVSGTEYPAGYPSGPYVAAGYAQYRDPALGVGVAPPELGVSYGERPPTPPSPSERSESPPPQGRDYLRKGVPYPQSGYDELDTTLAPPRTDPYRNTPSPGLLGDRYGEDRQPTYGYDSSNPYGNLPPRVYDHQIQQLSDPRGPPPPPHMGMAGQENGMTSPHMLYEDEDDIANNFVPHPGMVSPHSFEGDRMGVRWRDPDLHEVIEFLNNPNNVVKANAAAYLQHLCYMDDPIKQKTRGLGGIPPLVALLNHELPEVHRNACGALRNLSYGRQNDENKKAIKNAGGIPALVRLLRKITDNEVKELVTGVLWNLSSCEELKKSIIDDGLVVLVNHVVIPHSGWDRNVAGQDLCWTTVFRNASGVLRNVSSAGEYARRKLRECENLVDALLHVVKAALEKSDIDDKSVENCVCTLRNLSYRCQEVEDPNYDRHPLPTQSRASATTSKGDNLGCFGASRKKKEAQAVQQQKEGTTTSRTSNQQQRSEPVKGMELLWQPEVVQPYLSLLSNCSNPETLEAAAGAIQNLAACYWQPSIDIRAAVRKDKGLPILVELLRMEVDRVVCAVATALRNLAIDQRNKELIGKYAMRDLVQKLPSGSPQHDQGTSDETISAVLATLNEVIKKNADFSRSLLEAGGVERLLNITRYRQKYSPRVLKFASQVLYSMWQHQELREVYKKHGWKEQDFVTKTVAARNAHPSSPTQANNTLNRPMASQGGTRYEDKTMQRGVAGNSNNASRSPGPSNYVKPGEEVPLADMAYPDGGAHAPPGGVRMYPQPLKPGEPVYAKVNREKKKNRQYDSTLQGNPYGQDHQMLAGDGWVVGDGGPSTHENAGTGHAAGGDSWV